jgi:hypothetical protein
MIENLNFKIDFCSKQEDFVSRRLNTFSIPQNRKERRLAVLNSTNENWENPLRQNYMKIGQNIKNHELKCTYSKIHYQQITNK